MHLHGLAYSHSLQLSLSALIQLIQSSKETLEKHTQTFMMVMSAFARHSSRQT